MSRKPHPQPDRNSFATVMSRITGKAPRPPVEERDNLGYAIPPSRRVKKAVTTWQDTTAVQQLKDLAHERGVSQQKLIAEALNLLFAKYSKPTIAS
jgi:hypothetical protein